MIPQRSYYLEGKVAVNSCSYDDSGISASCNFSNNGIQGDSSYYGSMMQKVNWPLGGMSSDSSHENYYVSNAKNWYIYERSEIVATGNTTKDLSYLGLISGSDYALSTKANSSCTRSQNVNAYSAAGCANNNWMYARGDEWTLTHNSNTKDNVYLVNFTGQISSVVGNTHHSITPTIYLKDSVYVVEGKGTKTNPYIVAMK